MSKENELGTIQAMLDRLNNERLPRVLEMKVRVDRGECLTEADISYFERIFADADHARTLVSHHHELDQLVSKLVALYGEVSQKALENEKKA